MIGEDQKELPSTQTQTQTQTQNSVYVLENNENLPQRVTWGQLFTKSITIHDNGRKFVVFENPQQFNLTEEHWSAGRMDTLEFVFKSHHLTPAMLGRVSKVHFRLSRELEHPLRPVFIEDHSRNGTFVNGDLVGLNKKRILRTNDVISILNAEYKLFIFHDMMPDLSHNLPKMISRKYFVGSELGSGACGVVRLVYDIHSCQQFAMKQVVKMRLEDPGQKILNDPERIMNEVAIMKSLEHPCIVRMFDIYDRPESVFMILELMRGGDMISRISKMPQRRLPESSAKFFFVQMCEAIKYLHDKGITHRDIKPDNILLATEEEETLLKVTDFGLSKFVKKNSIMKTLCGTPQYVAPEILTTGGKGSYTKKVDIWSLGCCLYACLAGSVPFSGGVHGDIQDIANDIVRGSLKFDPTRWRSVSQRAIQVVTVCLTKNPGQRPSIEQLRSLEWMNDEAVIERVTRVMGRPVLQDVKEARRLHLQSSSRARAQSVAKTVPVQMEVTTTRVQASNGRHLFVQPGVRQRINNIRGSTPPAVTVPRPQTTAPAREYQDEPPLKRSRYC